MGGAAIELLLSYIKTSGPPTAPELTEFLALPPSRKQVAFDVQHHQTMMGLHQKVYSQEQVVGWFSTSAEVTGSDALIQSFFSNEASNPILLTVDAALSNGKLDISAYVSRTLSVKVGGHRDREREGGGISEGMWGRVVICRPQPSRGLQALPHRIQSLRLN